MSEGPYRFISDTESIYSRTSSTASIRFNDGPSSGDRELGPQRAPANSTDRAVERGIEHVQDDTMTLRSTSGVSPQTLRMSSEQMTSEPWVERAPSPSGSDVGQSIEMRPLKPDCSSAKPSSLHNIRPSDKTLSNEAWIWVLGQLGIPSVIAIAFMGIHLGFFSYLDRKPVDETITQGLQSAIANFFAFVVGTALLATIAVAYDQIIWCLFSRTFLAARTIDKLVTLTSSPWNVCRRDLMRNAPWPSALVWCCVLIPIACNFPPGALVVVDGQRMVYQRVPTLNARKTGDGTFADLHRYLLFDNIYGLKYGGPRGDLDAIASAVLGTGEVYTLPGPCYRLCSYTLEFEGPYWDCEEVDRTTSWFDWDELYAPRPMSNPTVFSAGAYRHSAVAGPHAYDVPDILAEHLVFQWDPVLNISDRSSWVSRNKPLAQLNCKTKIVNYWAKISYDEEGRRSIEGGVGNRDSALDIMPVGMDHNAILAEHVSGGSLRSANVRFSDEQSKAFFATQAYAIHDAAFRPISGYIYGSMSIHNGHTQSWEKWPFGFFVTSNGTAPGFNRIVQAFPDDPTIRIDITQKFLEQYLFNVTLSTVALNDIQSPLWQTENPVQIMNRTSIYSFEGTEQKIQFFLPYGLSLAATMMIALVGTWSLHKNGASAGNSFLQYVSTTRTSHNLQQLGLDSSRGGEQSFTENLKNIKLRFGMRHLPSNGCELGQSNEVVYGFGEAHEILPL